MSINKTNSLNVSIQPLLSLLVAVPKPERCLFMQDPIPGLVEAGSTLPLVPVALGQPRSLSGCSRMEQFDPPGEAKVLFGKALCQANSMLFSGVYSY